MVDNFWTALKRTNGYWGMLKKSKVKRKRIRVHHSSYHYIYSIGMPFH